MRERTLINQDLKQGILNLFCMLLANRVTSGTKLRHGIDCEYDDTREQTDDAQGYEKLDDREGISSFAST